MNKVILMGRLTKDPIVRYTAQNDSQEEKCVARYTLAINRRNTKEQIADFISCVAFGKSGEFAEKYLKKGIKIILTGRIQTGSYVNQEGQRVYITDVIVEEQEFAESKTAAQNSQGRTEPTSQEEGFMHIPEGIEEELPFT